MKKTFNDTFTTVDLGISGTDIVKTGDVPAFLQERKRLAETHGHDQARVIATGFVSVDEAQDSLSS